MRLRPWTAGPVVLSLAVAALALTPESAAGGPGPWPYVDASRNCDNVIRAKVLTDDGTARLDRVAAKARDGHELIPLDVRGNRVLFADYDCRDRRYERVRLATLGSRVRVVTVSATPTEEAGPVDYVSATFNHDGTRIVIGTGSQFGAPPDVTLRTYRTSNSELVRTTTLRGVGSLGRLDSGGRGVLYLQTTRQAGPEWGDQETVLVPVRGKQVGKALVRVASPWESSGSFISDVSRRGSVAIAPYAAAGGRVRIVAAGTNPPRSGTVNVCGRNGTEALAWLDPRTLMVDCGNVSFLRYLVDLSGAKVKKTRVDDFIGAPTVHPVGRG